MLGTKKRRILLCALPAVALACLVWDWLAWDIKNRFDFSAAFILPLFQLLLLVGGLAMALVYWLTGLRKSPVRSCLPLVLLVAVVLCQQWVTLTPWYGRLNYQLFQPQRSAIVNSPSAYISQISTDQYLLPLRQRLLSRTCCIYTPYQPVQPDDFSVIGFTLQSGYAGKSSLVYAQSLEDMKSLFAYEKVTQTVSMGDNWYWVLSKW